MAKKFKDLKAGDNIYEIYGGDVRVITIDHPFKQDNGQLNDWFAQVKDRDYKIWITKSNINKEYQKSSNLCANEEILKAKLIERRDEISARYKQDIEELKQKLIAKEDSYKNFMKEMDAQINGDYTIYEKKWGHK